MFAGLSTRLTCETLPCCMPSEDHTVKDDSDTSVETFLHTQLAKGNKTVLFTLGQFYFERGRYSSAMHYYKMASLLDDYDALFQLGVMLYDGINCDPDKHAGLQNMLHIIENGCRSAAARRLKRVAMYNVGRAYYEGFKGLQRSMEKAEQYWLKAAADGDPNPSVKAQSALGLLYSSPGHVDLEKSAFWHTVAATNGNLESTGIIGFMYMEGLGVKKDDRKAHDYLKAAMTRGNVFAMGQLVAHYYKHKLYNSAFSVATSVTDITFSPAEIGRSTDCNEHLIRRGIATAHFYLAHSFSHGHGTQCDTMMAARHYALCCEADKDTCALLQERARYRSL